MTNQNKASQTLRVRGYADNPMGGSSGLSNIANDKRIINHFSADATGNSIHAMGVGKIGYNGGSKNLRSAPPLKQAVLFYPQIQSIRPKWAGRFAVFGGVWQEQSPRCRRQLEHPHPFLMVAINLKTYGGHHA